MSNLDLYYSFCCSLRSKDSREHAHIAMESVIIESPIPFSGKEETREDRMLRLKRNDIGMERSVAANITESTDQTVSVSGKS